MCLRRWAKRLLPRDPSWEIKDEIEGFGSDTGIRLGAFLIFFNKLEIILIKICYQYWGVVAPRAGLELIT